MTNTVEGTFEDFLNVYGKLPKELKDKLFRQLFYDQVYLRDYKVAMTDLRDDEFEAFFEEPVAKDANFAIVLARESSTGPIYEVRCKREGTLWQPKYTPILCNCDDFTKRRENPCQHMRFVRSFYVDKKG